MTSRGYYQEDIERQEQLVSLADRTARAVETIRTILVVWALLSGFGLLIGVVYMARHP